MKPTDVWFIVWSDGLWTRTKRHRETYTFKVTYLDIPSLRQRSVLLWKTTCLSKVGCSKLYCIFSVPLWNSHVTDGLTLNHLLTSPTMVLNLAVLFQNGLNLAGSIYYWHLPSVWSIQAFWRASETDFGAPCKCSKQIPVGGGANEAPVKKGI